MLNYGLAILWFLKNYRKISGTMSKRSMFKSKSGAEGRKSQWPKKFNRYTTNIYQVRGFYSLVVSATQVEYISIHLDSVKLHVFPYCLGIWSVQLNSQILPFSPPPPPPSSTSPLLTHQVPPRQKTMPEQGPCPLLQLPGRQETGNPAPCQAPRLQTPAISTTRKTQPRTLRVHSICHFSILFCEPDALPVVKMKESSLTFQHLNLWWHLQNSKSELQ